MAIMNSPKVPRSEGVRPHLVKTAFKRRLLTSQNAGDQDEWPIFLLNSVKGIRSSGRNIHSQDKINYKLISNEFPFPNPYQNVYHT